MNKTLPRVKKFDTSSHAQGTKRPSEDGYRAVMEGRKALIGYVRQIRKSRAGPTPREPDSLKAGVSSLPDVVKSESNLPA
jgi:hypothetical protein